MISRTVLLLAIVGLSCAATWRGYLPKKPLEHAHKEGCYVEQINDVIPFGATVTPIGHCVRIDCDRQMISGASCGVVLPGPDCYKTGEDLTKPYPDCCPTVKCIEDNQVHKEKY